MNAAELGVFNVRDYGAVGDGQTLDTPAIQAAIEACHQHGGGTVTLPAGNFVAGSIFLRDNLTLNLEAGTALLAVKTRHIIRLSPVAGKAWNSRRMRH